MVSGVAPRRPLSYWAATRRPLPSLGLVLPIMLAYELGVLWQGGASAGSLRTGTDAGCATFLASLGWSTSGSLPLALVVILLGWQVASPRDWGSRRLSCRSCSWKAVFWPWPWSA